jgi:hypothetical protein
MERLKQMLIKRFMKVTIQCTMYDAPFEDEQVLTFRFYSPFGESAGSKKPGKVFSEAHYRSGYQK